jgi:hypothetical protein
MPYKLEKIQVQANLRHLSLAAQTRYYTGLRKIESSEPVSNRPKSDKTAPNVRKTETPKAKDPKSNGNHKYCDIHGKCNHTTAQCEIIEKQRDEYRAKSNAIKLKDLIRKNLPPVNVTILVPTQKNEKKIMPSPTSQTVLKKSLFFTTEKKTKF